MKDAIEVVQSAAGAIVQVVRKRQVQRYCSFVKLSFLFLQICQGHLPLSFAKCMASSAKDINTFAMYLGSCGESFLRNV